MQISSLPTNSSLQNTPRYQFALKLETINNLSILLGTILETVASQKWPWMQFSSLPTNSSLQNTPRYQILLKSETINNLSILLGAILETVASQRWPWMQFHHYQSIPHFKITLDINFHWNQRTLKFYRFWWRPFWK
jgi:hypothetical protein